MKKLFKIFKHSYKLIHRFILRLRECFFAVIYYKDIRLATACDCTRGIRYLHEKKVKFPHPVGVVIGTRVEIGLNCIIYQNVTIGTKDTKNYREAGYPIIGDNVTIYANAIIIGNIIVGNNCIIGPGAIVFQDLAENSTVVGYAGRLITK